MFNRASVAVALFTALTLFPAAPALAQGEILITQAKANAGNVTPGDTAGFPVTLSRPGSYILGSNLLPPFGKIGLHVTSHNVDIDMNGFSLIGGNLGTHGVYSKFGESRIHDGTIKTFKFNGILLEGGLTNSWVVENMQIVNMGGHGINAESSNFSRFLKNSILVNSGSGLVCGNSCHVEGNVVSGNDGLGIRVVRGTVLGNTVFDNGFYGVVSTFIMGLGNNTIFNNNAGGGQVDGGRIALFPNACSPGAC